MAAVTHAITEPVDFRTRGNCHHFLLELKNWWSVYCYKMPKQFTDLKSCRQEADEGGDEHEVSVDSDDGHAEVQKEATMLSVLKLINTSLVSGFKSVNSKLSTVDKNLDVGFKSLQEGPGEYESDNETAPDEADGGGADSDSRHAGDKAGREPPKKKRKVQHESEDEHSGDEFAPKGILSVLAEELDADNSTGPPLAEETLKFFKKCFEKPLTGEELKEKISMCHCPSNVDFLSTPRVNEVIWTKVPTAVKTRDKAQQKNHQTFLTSLSGVVTAINMLESRRANTLGSNTLWSNSPTP